MHVDCNLALIHILGIVVDDDAISLAELTEKVTRAQRIIACILSWDTDHIQEFLFDDAEGHKLSNFGLLLLLQAR